MSPEKWETNAKLLNSYLTGAGGTGKREMFWCGVKRISLLVVQQFDPSR